MKIHDTLRNSEQRLDVSKKIRMYLCGITTYDESHVGHARTVILFDVLRRYLEHVGADVQLVQNFTDVDDKIMNRAATEYTTAKNISARYIGRYFEDFDRLNVRRATTYPRATEHMEDIIGFIEKLMKKDVAYAAKNGVYFAVSKFQQYGKLSKKDTGELRAGARITVDDSKRNPLDFALWKFSDVEPAWQSPWGRGRPGWHIECSAMSSRYLGDNFEIHGGGRDLIFPHHENEIAQSESCTGMPLARIWMHVGMVTINGEKMSKSLGNIKTIRRMLEDWGPNIIRLFCLSGHYSKPIDYAEDMLRENLIKWRQAETCLYEIIHAEGFSYESKPGNIAQKCARDFDLALESDFNTHLALSSFFELVRETNRLAADEELGADGAALVRKEFDRMLQVLGLDIPKATDMQKAEIDDLVSKRETMRSNRKFDEADKIRDMLSEMSIELLDHGKKTVWVKRERINSDA